MKNILLITSLALLLTGCGTNPMLTKEGKSKVNGIDINIDRIKKIQSNSVDLNFTINPSIKVPDDFSWDEVKEEVKSILADKRITTSNSSKTVTVMLNSFLLHCSADAKEKITFKNGIAGGLSSAGLSVAQTVAVDLVDTISTKNRAQKESKECADNMFVPEVSFSIESDGETSNVNLLSRYAVGNPFWLTKKISYSIIAEFFEPATKKQL